MECAHIEDFYAKWVPAGRTFAGAETAALLSLKAQVPVEKDDGS